MGFTCKVINKKHILCTVVTLMLVIAGYVNYKYDETSKYKAELTGKIEEELGDAVFVYSDEVEIVNNEKEYKKQEDYFIETRIERTNTYSEQIENYETILANAKISTSQKEEAQKEIKNINDLRNAITIAENLIKLKGYENVVILVNGQSINIIVEAEKLDSTQIAQIQSIIMHEFKVLPEDIHITTKDD